MNETVAALEWCVSGGIYFKMLLSRETKVSFLSLVPGSLGLWRKVVPGKIIYNIKTKSFLG